MSIFNLRNSRKYRSISLAVLGALFLTTLSLLSIAWAATLFFEDIPTPPTPLPDNTCITRLITASPNITIAQVQFGLNITHTSRGDLTATLRSPAGTVVTLMNNNGGSSANYDINFADGGGPLDDGGPDDTNPPFYDRAVAPVNPLSLFNGQNGVGTWTLIVCDTASIDEGVYNRSRLTLVGDASFITYLPIIFKDFIPPVKTWASQTSGTATQLNGVSCPTNSTCFAVGNGGVIRATTNGGTNWTPQTSGTAQNLFDVSCPSASNCFAVGDGGTIRVTTNGGTNWTPQSSGVSNILREVSCFGATCMAVGGTSTAIAVLTTNGGANWNPLPFLANSSFSGVSCASTDTCVAAGQAGRIFVFISQGINAKPEVGLNNDLQGVHCPSTSACFSVASNGTIWATANGLNNWSGQTSGTSQNLFGVSCASAATCFAVGNNGTIRATINGGSGWTGETSNTSANLFDISCPGNCFAVGSGGKILIGQ